MSYNPMVTNLNVIRFKDNDLTKLNEVKIFDKHGNLKKVVSQDRIKDPDQYRRSYGELPCRVCKVKFTVHKKRQLTCEDCINKRPMCGVSFRRTPLKSEKQMRGHANVTTQI